MAILRRYTPSGEFAWIPFAYKMGWRTKNYKYHVCRRVLSWIPWSSSPCCEPCMRCMSSLPRIAQLVFQQFPPFQRFLCYPPTSVAWHFSHHVLNWWKGKLCSQIRAKGALGSHWSQNRFPTTQVWFQKQVRWGFWLPKGLILKIRWNLCCPLESIHYPAFPHNNFFSFFLPNLVAWQKGP